MRPSFPVSWFDLVITPFHDNAKKSSNLVCTYGALNRVRNSGTQNENAGLILIGGHSSHYQWNDGQLVQQIKHIVNSSGSVQWVLTTSRRTPGSFIQALHEQVVSDRLTVTPYEETGDGWMESEMARASQMWVTPDSVSMLYESLTSGACVSVLELEGGSGCIAKGVHILIAEGHATSYQQWLESGALNKAAFSGFNEAERVATLIEERWFGS
ncbi:ELM1/GtrOC1 family putative glycosyltransferase [Solemya elarraichensis gill symbiont]